MGRSDGLGRAFAELSDRRLVDLVADADRLGSGIGGTTSLARLDGAPVFVKRIPLTDRERLPENVGSTANLFDLPLYCQYGVGGPSFGAWRELAAHQMTTTWVREGRSSCFPLLYHSRVMEGSAFGGSLPDEWADVDRLVEHWHGSSAVRQRVEAIADSSATLTLFLEYLPEGLPARLAAGARDRSASGGEQLAAVDTDLRSAVTAMNRSGLLHFDAHLDNIRADDSAVYFVDFGLATSPSFAVSEAESIFLTDNRSHDACYAMTRLVDWLVTALSGVVDWQERNEWIRRCASGDDVCAQIPPAAAALIERYAPVAVVINDFYRRLHLHDRRTPYPRAEAEAACAKATLAWG